MATTLNEFVQLVKVVGADEAVRVMKELGVNTADLGKITEETGEKSGKSAGFFDQMAESGKRWLAGMGGLGAIVQLFRQFVDSLRDAVRLQDELANKASRLANESKTLARQLGVDEAKGASVLTSLRIAGGLNAGTARELGIAADIAFADQGGLLAGQNLQTTKDLAAFMGTAGFSGEEASSLLSLLKAAGALGSPEEAKMATAKIAAAARASKASSIGAFTGQLNRGGTGLLQAGVPLDDVLELAGQARQVFVTEELAATAMERLQQLAVAGASKSFDREIAKEARARGLDPKELTAADRVAITRDLIARIATPQQERRFLSQAGPERGLSLLKMLRGENVAAAAPVGAAARSATADEFDLEVERGRNEITFREQQNQAALEMENYQTGVETFTITAARARAKAALERDIATGRVKGVTDLTREGEEERYVRAIFERTIADMRRQGIDTTQAEAALGSLGEWGMTNGYDDSRLYNVAHEIDEARRDSSLNRQANLRAPRVTVVNVATQYNEQDPTREPQPVLDRND